MKVLFRDLDREQLKALMALTKEYGTQRMVMADDEENGPFLTMERTSEDKVETRVQLVFEDPFAFGMAFVDASRIIAQSFMKDEGATSPVDYLKRIREGFEAEFDHMTTDIETWSEEEDP